MYINKDSFMFAVFASSTVDVVVVGTEEAIDITTG